jgi:hypothetical protein
MKKTRTYTVKYVKAYIFADGKTATELVKSTVMKGTFDEVLHNVRSSVRPIFGGLHYDNDWHKVITRKSIDLIDRGFECTYKINYLDDVRSQRPFKEEIWVIAQC